MSQSTCEVIPGWRTNAVSTERLIESIADEIDDWGTEGDDAEVRVLAVQILGRLFRADVLAHLTLVIETRTSLGVPFDDDDD